ncbi:flavin-containing monooxygenase [[Mycobacterium] crassicus]|uniref:NAD(P)-binding domain-containing protein n=1 Tax=[Mycobacterium] crassicus TaxID=2872309 RepID=A0ABU5XFB2_9MYCO|nr:NAD(P)-binding domain-containing protein [Mycolicibacter sp. MYC098]MEB3020863.1 NAD(P)-binding domain-containing protein [Mycolicibacter sp. MYC098]
MTDSTNGLPRACVIGAGSAGLAACAGLKGAGIAFDCYEKSDRVGGLWVFDNPSGTAAAYRTLNSNAPKAYMGYHDFPMPADLPSYPSHWDFARYFDDYARHFGLHEHIRFQTEVTRVTPRTGGGFAVELSDGSTQDYDYVLVANGHHWDPRMPEPMFPGTFDGTIMHSREYRDPAFMAGKRVAVVGIGNSAVDIACEAAHVADKTILSVRRGAHIMPKYVFGMAPPNWLLDSASYKLGRIALGALMRLANGRGQDYGLPVPDHAFGNAHPTMSASIMDELRMGRIQPKPRIAELLGDRVRFVDGSVEQVDMIVCATGYNITFPFFDESYFCAPDNQIALYHRVVHPDRPGLFFIGLCQPLGAIQPLAELQGKWVGALLSGTCALPSPQDMCRAIEADQTALRKRFIASTRHTVQVDHNHYLKSLRREIGEGRRRARRLRTTRNTGEVRRLAATTTRST